jgi:uracil phosphoribosyltransferase
VRHKQTQLRDTRTDSPTFRALVRELAQLLFFEASGDLRVEAYPISTPLADYAGEHIAEAVGLLPILRAGLGMAEAVLDLLPTAQVWHLGLYRDHQTLKPVTYYNKLPPEPTIERALVLDPMLATGGSAVAAVDVLKRWGLKRIQYLGLIAAPEGVKLLREAHPDVPIYLAAVDSHLNEKGYIVPGLGDAGDRQFGTGS